MTPRNTTASRWLTWLDSVSDKVQSIFRATGLKVATQDYEYTSAGLSHQGQNVYAIIHAPRGDATEAIVIVTAWKTVNGELNTNAVSLALTLARYFRRGWRLIREGIRVANLVQGGRYGPKISYSSSRRTANPAHRLGSMPIMTCSRRRFSLYR